MVATFNGMSDPSTIWDRYDPGKIDAWFSDVAKSASMVIAVSGMVKKDLLRRVYVPEERIRIIPYGVSEEFRPINDKQAVNAVLSKYRVAGKRYLLYAGGAEPNKNLSALIDAFSALSKNAGAADLYLVLAGKIDHFYCRLITKAETLGIAQKVIFTDYIAHDDLPFIYNGAEAFVLPTLLEWFGIPVLEAMACGIPVIASKNTGAIEAVGSSLVTFDPADAKEMADSISAVLHDRGLRLSLREKGLERVKGLSWKDTARKTFAVYSEVHNKRH
jgi:glycosyltransferase involved in cell wall biosynthesis